MDESHRKPIQLNKRTSLGKFMTQLSDYKMLLKFNKEDEKILSMCHSIVYLCVFLKQDPAPQPRLVLPQPPKCKGYKRKIISTFIVQTLRIKQKEY